MPILIGSPNRRYAGDGNGPGPHKVLALGAEQRCGRQQHMSNRITWSGFMHPRAVIGFPAQSLSARLSPTCPGLCACWGLSVYFMLPSRYGSTALILVDPRQTNVTNTESAVSVIGGDAAALTSYVEVMNSDGFLRKHCQRI